MWTAGAFFYFKLALWPLALCMASCSVYQDRVGSCDKPLTFHLHRPSSLRCTAFTSARPRRRSPAHRAQRCSARATALYQAEVQLTVASKFPRMVLACALARKFCPGPVLLHGGRYADGTSDSLSYLLIATWSAPGLPWRPSAALRNGTAHRRKLNQIDRACCRWRARGW